MSLIAGLDTFKEIVFDEEEVSDADDLTTDKTKISEMAENENTDEEDIPDLEDDDIIKATSVKQTNVKKTSENLAPVILVNGSKQNKLSTKGLKNKKKKTKRHH